MSECFHERILIEPVETRDGQNKIVHMCRYTCQQCGKIIQFIKDLNYQEEGQDERK